jgi:hypothetical protein
MRTVRKLAAVLACTALLSIVGASAAGADPIARCDHMSKLTERIDAKRARIAARATKRPGGANVGQNHRPDLETKVQDKLATLRARCAG